MVQNWENQKIKKKWIIYKRQELNKIKKSQDHELFFEIHLLYLTRSEEIPSRRYCTKRERGKFNLFKLILIVMTSSYDKRVANNKGILNRKSQ